MNTIKPDELMRRLDMAVAAGDVATITRQVQRELESVLLPGKLDLPDRFRQTRPDRYARRLLHRDPALRYTVLVLAWAPGQGTSIHDHPNVWSVEAVLEGELEVTHYNPVKELQHRCKFAPVDRRRVVAGDANFLLPPFEYHALMNDLAERPALTLHVFGGELMEINTFDPGGDGWYERSLQRLTYDE